MYCAPPTTGRNKNCTTPGSPKSCAKSLPNASSTWPNKASETLRDFVLARSVPYRHIQIRNPNAFLALSDRARRVLGAGMKKASEYRKHADECRRMLASFATEEQKAMLENMAKTWDTLADDRERQVVQRGRLTRFETSTEETMRKRST